MGVGNFLVTLEMLASCVSGNLPVTLGILYQFSNHSRTAGLMHLGTSSVSLGMLDSCMQAK